MKVIIAFLLSSILMVHFLGHGLTFMVQLRIARQEMKRAIKAEKAVKAVEFRFSQSEYLLLQKFENKKEFLWQGGMYDVVSKNVVNDTIVLTAYYDHRETNLMGDIARFVEKNLQIPTTNCKVAWFTLSEYDVITFNWCTIQSFHSFHIPAFCSSICTIADNVELPPPDTSMG